MARPDPLAAGAVFVGGALGTGLRWFLGELLSGWFTAPWTIVGVNVAGAFLLGLFMSRRLAPVATAFFATGFLGGFTTYSAFAGYVDLALQQGDVLTAGGQLVATVGFGFAAALCGLRLGREK